MSSLNSEEAAKRFKCVDKDTKINLEMLGYMKRILKINKNNNVLKDELFTGENLKCVNNTIRNQNYYTLDKYNLPIRKNCQDSKKTAFGWRYNENQEPINIHIDSILLQTESKDITKITLQQLKQQSTFANLFKPPRGTIYRIYSNEFPEMNIENI